MRTFSADGKPSEWQQPAKPTGEQFFTGGAKIDPIEAAKKDGGITDEDIKRLAERTRGV